VGDGKGFRTAITPQITLHSVIGDVHAIGTLIDEDCDWRVRSSIGHVPDHFFHDERIADHKPYDLRVRLIMYPGGSCSGESAREQLDAGDHEPCFGARNRCLEVLCKTTIAVEPGDGSFDDPAAWQ
jgi:hypothetical protein